MSAYSLDITSSILIAQIQVGGDFVYRWVEGGFALLVEHECGGLLVIALFADVRCEFGHVDEFGEIVDNEALGAATVADWLLVAV